MWLHANAQLAQQEVAAFVIEKIKKGVMPPSITTDELRTLGLQ